MNYLSHQAVAEAVAEAEGEQPGPRFFVGNILPDLIATAGSRLRARDLKDAAPTTPESKELLRGIELHFATDARFHSHPDFKAAMAEASSLLRAAPFSRPLHRVFFVAHVFVEISLDGLILHREQGIAERLYAALEAVGPEAIVREAAELLGASVDAPDLAAGVRRFIAARYLPTYREYPGQAEALARIMVRAGVGELLGETDRATLATALAAFAPRLKKWETALLAPPPTPPDPVVQ